MRSARLVAALPQPSWPGEPVAGEDLLTVVIAHEVDEGRRLSAFAASDVATIGYSATTLRSAGISTPAASSPAAWTSVAYTIPASASPSTTLFSTALTFSSKDFGVTVTPALANTSTA